VQKNKGLIKKEIHKNMSKKLNAIAKRFFTPQLKVLYKAEFIDDKNELTDLGREHLEVIVLEKHMLELVKVAETVEKENKKEQ